MKKTPKLSETEWDIMRVIWTHPGITSAEIVERLNEGGESWHPKTVRTLLARLVEKKALGYEEDGRSYVYRPLVKEGESVAAASGSFVERVFGGALKPMLVHFLEQKKLTKAELDEIRALLDKGSDQGAKARKKESSK